MSKNQILNAENFEIMYTQVATQLLLYIALCIKKKLSETKIGTFLQVILDVIKRRKKILTTKLSGLKFNCSLR